MTLDDFTALLDRRCVPWRLGDDGLVIGEGWNGYVDLYSLTSLPETQPVTFSNGGYVDLSSLTSLPETQPVTFSNGGYVDFYSLTSLPDGHLYQGKRRHFIYVDGYTMLLQGRWRAVGDAQIVKCAYLSGGPVEKLKPVYVAREGDLTAHGATPDEALRDLRFKIAQVDYDPAELVATIKRRCTITFNDFRLLTGACAEGLRHGLIEAGFDVPPDELPLAEALKAAHGPYGDAFRRMFAEEVA